MPAVPGEEGMQQKQREQRSANNDNKICCTRRGLHLNEMPTNQIAKSPRKGTRVGRRGWSRRMKGLRSSVVGVEVLPGAPLDELHFSV